MERPSPLSLQILLFTLLRIILHTSYRMLYPFLAVFARGLGVDLAAISLAIIARSIMGTVGPFLASIADSRGRKSGMLLGVTIYTLAVSLVALWPSYPAFFFAMVVSALGNFVFVPSMQAYLGDRVAYAQRGRSMAITELSWSLSFILGIPAVGLLIDRLGWTAPFPILAGFGLLILVALAWILPNDAPPVRDRPSLWKNFRIILVSPVARAGLIMGMSISIANELVNLVFGVWMENSFGLQIAALGAASAVIGLSELAGEGLTAALVDRVGKERSIRLGLILNCLAALSLPLLASTVTGALIGLFFFYLTFEFTIVCVLPLMSALLPNTRATLMATNIATLSLGRAVGAFFSPILFAFGMGANVAGALVFNLVGIVLLSQVKADE